MAPPDKAKNTKPSAELEAMINKSFGSLDEMKAAFEARKILFRATRHFNSIFPYFLVSLSQVLLLEHSLDQDGCGCA
jgi:hypothetical protein